MNNPEAPMYQQGDIVRLAPWFEWSNTRSGKQLGGAWVKVLDQIRWDTSGDHDKWVYYVLLEDKDLWNVSQIHMSEDLICEKWGGHTQKRLI